jgi:hypothetical protein
MRIAQQVENIAKNRGVQLLANRTEERDFARSGHTGTLKEAADHVNKSSYTVLNIRFRYIFLDKADWSYI